MLSFGKFLLKQRGTVPKFNPYFLLWKKKFSSGDQNPNNYKTMQEIGQTIKKILSGKVKKESLLSRAIENITSPDELPAKRMKDSLDCAVIPLSSDEKLREQYTAFFGNIRIGRLMEDLDLFAVWCCIKHLSNPEEWDQAIPYIIVTIRVDHVEFFSKFHKSDTDVRLSGFVCWVGRSSLDITVSMDQLIDGKWERKMQALMLFAVRKKNYYSAALVNPLIAETEEEKALLKKGEERKVARMADKMQSLLKKEPSELEYKIIHGLFLKTVDEREVFLSKRTLPPNSKWMQDTILSTLIFCHPEHRNSHDKVFGGFLMRQALELSWSTAYFFGMRYPKLIHISDIAFHSPVDVGSLLYLNSSVTYTEDHFIQVFVHAIAHSQTKEPKTTNSFYFTYDLEKPCYHIYPSTYLEAMQYIDGLRHFRGVPSTAKRGI